jgi:hypothetical protein
MNEKILIHGVWCNAYRHRLLHDVSFKHDLRLNLISTKTLCTENNFLILFINTKALVIDKNILQNKHKPPHEFIACIINMNTKDNLYYINDNYQNNNDKLNL